MADRMTLGDISPKPSQLTKRVIGRILTELAVEWNSPNTPNKAETVASLQAALSLLGHRCGSERSRETTYDMLGGLEAE
jgi:hypothetical protein